MPPMMEPAYTYCAEYRSNYDGDTIRVDIDLGLGMVNRGEDGKGVILRLHRINTPELRGGTEASKAAGRAAKDFVRETLWVNSITIGDPDMLSRKIIVQTIKDKTGKYGRYLAVVWYKDGEGLWRNLNDDLVEQGHAEVKDY